MFLLYFTSPCFTLIQENSKNCIFLYLSLYALDSKLDSKYSKPNGSKLFPNLYMPKFLHNWILVSQCCSHVQLYHIFKWFIWYEWAYIVSVPYSALTKLEYIVSVPYIILKELNILSVCLKLSWQTLIYCECALHYIEKLEYIVSVPYYFLDKIEYIMSVPYSTLTKLNILWVCLTLS
jgi:hypothetical protein